MIFITASMTSCLPYIMPYCVTFHLRPWILVLLTAIRSWAILHCRSPAHCKAATDSGMHQCYSSTHLLNWVRLMCLCQGICTQMSLFAFGECGYEISYRAAHTEYTARHSGQLCSSHSVLVWVLVYTCVSLQCSHLWSVWRAQQLSKACTIWPFGSRIPMDLSGWLWTCHR